MPSIDQAKQKSFDLYTALDEMAKILPIIGADFNVQAGPGRVRLPQDQIVVIKQKYTELQAIIKNIGITYPTIQELNV